MLRDVLRGTTIVPNPLPQLQERLEQDVILMVVRDQREIDVFGKIVVGVAGNRRLVL